VRVAFPVNPQHRHVARSVAVYGGDSQGTKAGNKNELELRLARPNAWNADERSLRNLWRASRSRPPSS
jgi:hypothetical protein